MVDSPFIEYIRKYFKGQVTDIVKTINGSTNAQPAYLFQRLLRPQFSVTGKWESLTVNDQPVAADFVAMDSPLPIKSRATQGSASGTISKMGMRKQLNETQLTELDTMAALRVAESDIVAMLFRDDQACITGIFEKLEYTLQKGLSNGDAVITDEDNVGTGVRVKYVPDANRKGVPVVWTNVNATPLADLAAIRTNIAQPKGENITVFRTDRATINNIRKTNEVKDFYAFSQGNFGTVRPVPSVDALNDISRAEYGFTFEIVEKIVTLERDGVKTPVNPWKPGAVVGFTADVVGTLFYARLAEDNHRKGSVEYQNANEYILVSKEYQTNPALAQVTKSQARVAPIVTQPLYLVDSLTVEA